MWSSTFSSFCLFETHALVKRSLQQTIEYRWSMSISQLQMIDQFARRRDNSSTHELIEASIAITFDLVFLHIVDVLKWDWQFDIIACVLFFVRIDNQVKSHQDASAELFVRFSFCIDSFDSRNDSEIKLSNICDVQLIQIRI